MADISIATVNAAVSHLNRALDVAEDQCRFSDVGFCAAWQGTAADGFKELARDFSALSPQEKSTPGLRGKLEDVAAQGQRVATLAFGSANENSEEWMAPASAGAAAQLKEESERLRVAVSPPSASQVQGDIRGLVTSLPELRTAMARVSGAPTADNVGAANRSLAVVSGQIDAVRVRYEALSPQDRTALKPAFATALNQAAGSLDAAVRARASADHPVRLLIDPSTVAGKIADAQNALLAK